MVILNNFIYFEYHNIKFNETVQKVFWNMNKKKAFDKTLVKSWPG